MPFENLPGDFVTKLDGNLAISSTNDSPIVVVIGTANQGNSEELFTVVRPNDAARTFGKTGTLPRGMYEALGTGATNIRLFRIGATSATITNFGGGISIETVAKDDTAGTQYGIFYVNSTERLKIFRAIDSTLVYDSGDGVDPDTVVDLGEVSVSGEIVSGINVGTGADDFVLLEDVPDTDTGAVFTAGTDGVNLTRMKLYEELDKAYTLLEDADIDIVLPMNAYLDDGNVKDQTSATISGLMTGIDAFDDIVVGGPTDILGLLYVEEFEGVTYYFWDIDQDGVAEIVPTVAGITSGQQVTLELGAHSIAAVVAGSASDLTTADFREVNFAYQLANFCYQSSHLNTEMHGVIGVRPPSSFSAKDVSLWVGSPPVTAIDADGVEQITTNGEGLLGNKFMAGRMASGTIPAFIVDGFAAPGGGFIATDDEYINGVQLEDANEKLVDIGKYLDVVAAYVQVSNPSRSTAYIASGAAAYAGLLATLPAASAPTNKKVNKVSLPYRINKSKLDLLAGKKYVSFLGKPQGTVVADAPTAARSQSDYTRRSTMRIVKASIDVIRLISEPFLGEGMTGAQLEALQTSITQGLSELVKARTLQRFSVKVTANALERVQGKCQVDLVLVPAFELRQINITLALAAA